MATAGFAAAQGIEFDGAAEFGFAGGGAGVTEGFHQSIDLGINFSGETDNGLSFGASIDLDDALERGAPGIVDVVDNDPDFTVFISGAFGNLTLGDTDSGMDWALTEAVGQPGSIGDDETTHAGYVGGNYLDEAVSNQVLRYDNTFGAFGIAASIETSDTAANTGDFGYSLGVSYDLAFAGGEAEFGLGYTDADTANGTATAVTAAVMLDSGFSAGIMYADGGGALLGEHYQISAGYEFGPFAIGANYGEFSNAGGGANGYGVSGSYDLGGGAALHLGFNDSNGTTGPSGGPGETYSFGLAMSF